MDSIKSMKKEERTEVISFEEFIDYITEGRGEEIKKELKKISQRRK